MSEAGRRYLVLGLLWLVVLLLFGQVVSHPFQSADDNHFILHNPEIVKPAEANFIDLLLQPHIGYIVPVTGLTQALLYHLGDGEPWVFHVANLVLHVLVVSLLFLLIELLTGHILLAGLGALIFGVHPIVVEPVAWATGLKDLLMATFALLGTILFVREMKSNPDERPGWPLGLAGLCAWLALLSKPTGALIAFAWVAYLISSTWGKKRPIQKTLLLLVGVLGVSGIVTIMSWLMHDTLNVAGESEHALIAQGRWIVLIALGYQFHHLVWPNHLFPRYPDVRMAGFNDIHTSLGLLILIGFVTALVLFRYRSEVTLGLWLALCAYLPVSSIVPFMRMIADSYVYLPTAGLVLAVTSGLRYVLPDTDRIKNLDLSGRVKVGVGVGVVACLVVMLSVRTRNQGGRWSSVESLWYPATQVHDNWPYAWMQMAEGFTFEKDYPRAVKTYEQLYARTYVKDYLPSFAVALFQASNYAEAQCVAVEDLHYGADKERALKNLATLLVVSDHPIRYPYFGHQALRWALQKRASKTLPWSKQMLQDLTHKFDQLDETGPHPKPESWPIRNCQSLRAEKVSGPP